MSQNGFIQATVFCLLSVIAGMVSGLLAPACADDRQTDRTLPNVILIMTDNHAPWTLGCYGNADIRTPQIDSLARKGVLFTHCFSSNSVCSPTRATFLTGLIPSQHGVHCYLRAGGAQIGPQAHSTIAEFQTLPEVLSQAGYTCGLSGKWHLGDNLRPQEGFTFWVTKPHGHTSTFYDAEIIENGEIIREPTYLTDFWTKKGLEFIDRNRQRPFFLFLAYNGPYGLGKSLLEPARNRHEPYYSKMTLDSFPRQAPHPWLRANRPYINNIRAMRRYAAEISGVDDGVGQILAALHRLGLDDQTLVIFTADQGLCGGQHGMWGMGDHSRPIHTFDEACHIPMIWRHTGKIVAGERSDVLISNYDLMTTLLAYLRLDHLRPSEPPSPGRDFSPILAGRKMNWKNEIFHEFENTRMIRTSQWKYTRRFPDGPDELYHLVNDPGEDVNLVGKAENAPIQTATCAAVGRLLRSLR